MALLCLPNSSAEHTAWERAMRDAITRSQFDATELMTNTGALKASWTQGIDPNSCYTGDVEDMFQLGSVYKGYTVDGMHITHCDEYVPYVDKGVQTESSSPPDDNGEGQKVQAMLTYSTIQTVELKPEPSQHDPTDEVSQISQRSLRTSDEPTFTRTEQEPIPPWAQMKISGRRTAKDTTAPAALPPPKTNESTPKETPLTT
jgi:hypothetical protein